MYKYFKSINTKLDKTDIRKIYLKIFSTNYRYIPVETENNKIYHNPLSRVIFKEFDKKNFEILPEEILNLEFLTINTLNKNCSFIVYFDHISTINKPEINMTNYKNRKKIIPLSVKKLTQQEQIKYNTGINYYKYGKINLNYSKLGDGDYYIEFKNLFSAITYAFSINDSHFMIKNLKDKKPDYIKNILFNSNSELINKSIIKNLNINFKKNIILIDNYNNKIVFNNSKKNYSDYLIKLLKKYFSKFKIPLYILKSEDKYFKALNKFYKKAEFTDNIEIFGTNIFKRYRFMIINQLMDFFKITKNMFAGVNQRNNLTKENIDYLKFESSPFSNEKIDTIIFDNARKTNFENCFIDPSSKIILDEYNKKNIPFLVLEQDYNKKHFNTSHKSIKYLDGIYTYEKKFNSNIIFLQILKTLIKKQHSTNLLFETILKILISKKSVSYMINYFYYYSIFKKTTPKKVFVVGPYKSYIYNVAHDLNIKRIELQYAAIEENHPGFVSKNNIRDFPDEMILFNTFWIDKIKHYIPKNKIKIIDNKYFNQGIKTIKSNSENTYDICFISQGTIGKKLAILAYKFCNNYPKYKVIYRLHPNENKTSYNILNKMAKLRNLKLVSSTDESIYLSISKSKLITGVYSTCLFDAYFANKKIAIAKLPGWSYVKNMIENNIFYLISNEKDLINYINKI